MAISDTVALMNQNVKAVVLFSGVGGSSLGLKQAGVADTVGVEWDKAIGEAAQANGIKTHIGDVRELDPYGLVSAELGVAWHPTARRATLFPERNILLLQASPSCQSFSAAGKQSGKSDLPLLAELLREYGELPDEVRCNPEIITEFRDRIHVGVSDPRSSMSLEPIFWIAQLQPELISFEQVVGVRPLWEVYAEVLRSWGYSVWVENLSAEQYGVPQTRKRSYLGASLLGDVTPPAPTHSKYYSRTPEKVDDGLPKWISMAEALSAGMTARPSLTVTGGGQHDRRSGALRDGGPGHDEAGDGGWTLVSNYGTGGDACKRGRRMSSQPAPTVTSKVDRNKVVAS